MTEKGQVYCRMIKVPLRRFPQDSLDKLLGLS